VAAYLSTGTAGNGKCLGYEADAQVGCPAVGAIDILQALVPASGATISNLQVQLDANAAGSGNTVTVLDNAVATTLTCTVPSGSKTCSDATHSVSVIAGHFLTVQVTNQSGAANRAYRVSFRY
jgi:hypothetical protein